MKSIFAILLVTATAVLASPTPHKVKRAQLVSTPQPTATVATTPTAVPRASLVATPTPEPSVEPPTPEPSVEPTTQPQGNPGGNLFLLGIFSAAVWFGVKWLFNRPPPPPSPAELDIQRQILEDLRSGVVIDRVSAPGYFCKAGEKVLYAFNNVKCYRLKGHAHYVGGSQGVSVRIMKGVSYHVGAHHGHREVTQSMDFQGIGALVFTNQAMNFIGPTSCRVLFKHIIDFKWYNDGIGFDTDAQTGNRYAFGGLRTADVQFLGQAVAPIN
jgi:uncharacterized protein YjlB